MNRFNLKRTLSRNLCALLAAAPLVGFADTEIVVNPASGAGAQADLNFSITIPGFILFQVGTNTAGSVDTISFTVGENDLINQTTGLAGTGGNTGGGVVDVRLLSNVGQITILEGNDGGGNGLIGTNTGASIDYAQINTSSNNANLPPPVLSNSGGNTSTPTAAGQITDLSAQWTYTLDNDYATLPVPDTYTGTVTYTAAAP